MKQGLMRSRDHRMVAGVAGGMAERFGQAKMFVFFSELVLEPGNLIEEAARTAFGTSWANVNADCARYVRRHA